MARGTQHRKRRPTANAGVEPQPKAKSKKPQHETWEDQLFFNRLRNHAKPVFIMLILVFGASFVLLGVGSGSSGIGDILGNFFTGSSSTGPSASSLQKKAQENPKNPAVWRELSTALMQKDDLDEAIVALTRYTELKPKDDGALQELGGLYLRSSDVFAQQYLEAQSRAQALSPDNSFKPATGSPLAQALQDPIAAGILASLNATTSTAYAKYIETQGKAVVVYKQLVALNPKDATNQYRLAQVAQQAGKTTEAIAAYKAFLKLAPDDSLAPAAKKALKALTAPTTPKVTAG